MCDMSGLTNPLSPSKSICIYTEIKLDCVSWILVGLLHKMPMKTFKIVAKIEKCEVKNTFARQCIINLN